jgi:hypothetical protein
MATATRAKSASKPAAKTEKPVKDVEVDLPDVAGKLLAEIAEARLAKSAADRKEKAAKAQLTQLLPKHKKRTRLVLKIAGEIRGKVSWRSRTGLDPDLLMQGWPEAYEACKTTSEYQVIN